MKILEKINEKIGRFFSELENREKTTLFSVFFISLSVRLLSTNFNSLLQKDAFVYLLQALDMVHGNFMPSASQSVGLSLFSVPFFLIFGSDSIFHNMAVARAVSCFFGAIIIFPLFLLAKELCEKRVRILILIFFAFLSTLVFNATLYLTETLFSFFFLFSLYFAVRHIKKSAAEPEPEAAAENIAASNSLQKVKVKNSLLKTENLFIYFSFFFAGLSYYVRPNGIFVLAVLIITYLIAGRRRMKKIIVPLLIGFIIFWAAAAPFLFQRYEFFGSPFTYGENDKYWVENYSRVWSSNLEKPTALEYFRSHNLKEIFYRFAVMGAGRFAFDLFRPKDLPLLFFFFLIGASLNIFKKQYWPLYISLLVFWGGISLVYYVFYTGRYCLPLFLILLIFMAEGVYEVLKSHKYKEALLGLFIACYIFLSVIAIYKTAEPDLTMPDWAVWSAENIKGKISVMEGGDFIIMNLPDATTAGVGQKDLYAPKSGVSVMKPGYFIDLPEAMAYFKKIGLTHIIYDDQHLSWRWYLREMPLPQYKDWFKKIYSNADSPDPWKVKIYEIQWDKYNK